MLRDNLASDKNIISNQIANLINTPIEQNFERLAQMTKRMFDVPVIVIGLFDEKRKAIKPVVSLDFGESSQYIPFFKELNSDDVLVVEDTTKNEQFKNHQLVIQDPKIRFIVCCPIFEKNGKKIGSLIMLDHKPRSLKLNDLMNLSDIVKLIENEINSFSLSKAQRLLLQEISNKDKTRFIDAQTRIWSYEGCTKILEYQMMESQKENSHFGLVAIDIDNLMDMNHQHGKDVVDEVLTLISRLIIKSCRDEDTVARGQDEHFMVLVHANELEHIKMVVERIKTNIEKEELKSSKGALFVTVTIGVACFNDEITNTPMLIENTKLALLRGKQLGHNRIEFN